MLASARLQGQVAIWRAMGYFIRELGEPAARSLRCG